MRALHVMVQRLADVMNQGPSFSYCHICAKFLRNHTSDVRHLNGMLKHILSITGAEIQSSNDSYNSRIKIEYSTFINRLLALFLNYFIYFLFCFRSEEHTSE